MEDRLLRDASVEFRVRTMIPDDLPQVMELFEQLEWVVGVNTVNSWFQMDPKGWKVAVNGSEEVLGVCSAGQLTDDICLLNCYVVRERYRGMGIGLKVWNSCMEYVGQRDACLRSVSDMVKNYKKSGFLFVDPDYLSYYAVHNEIQTENLSSEVPEGVSLVPFENSHLSDMMEYDPFHGKKNFRRQRIIELASKDKDSKTLVAFKDGACVGFGIMQTSSSNTLWLSPMYVEDVKIAEAMLKQLIQSFPDNKGLTLMTFAANKVVGDLMKKIDCPKIGETHHMYTSMNCTKFKFKSSMDKLFALLEFDMLDF